MKKNIFYITLPLFFISFELFSMEEKKESPAKKQKLEEKKIIPIKTLKEIAKQKFIEVIPELENVPELLESIPAEEVRQEIKAEAQKKLPFDQTRLHNAKSAQEVENLLTLGVNPNLKDRRGRTVLNALIEKGFLNAALYLIEKEGKNLDVTSPDIFGITPLQNAIEHEDEKLAKSIFKILKQNSSEIRNEISNFNTTARSAFTLAIAYMPKLAKKFLKQGAYMHQTNKYRQNPLMFAAKFNPSLIQPFIDSDSKKLLFDSEKLVNSKDKEGKTPLMFAAESNPDSVEILLQNDAILKNIDAQDNKGRTALMYAVIKNNQKAIKSLIGAGANINIENKVGGTALLYAALYSPKAIKYLIKAGANPNDPDKNGSFILPYIIEQNSLEEVKKFLKFGGDPNVQDHKGIDALSLAILKNNSEMVKLLLAKGAKITKDALQRASFYPEIQELLNEHLKK